MLGQSHSFENILIDHIAKYALQKFMEAFPKCLLGFSRNTSTRNKDIRSKDVALGLKQDTRDRHEISGHLEVKRLIT